MQISMHQVAWPLKQRFEITGHIWHEVPAITLQLRIGDFLGQAESEGVYYLNESPTSMITQIESVLPQITDHLTQEQIQNLLPPGGARNALDCAFWDLRCKQSGQSIWQLTGITPKPVQTVMTVGLESSPEAMAEKASSMNSTLLKVKLNADRPVERLNAIMHACPNARIVVDANQGWNMNILNTVISKLANTAVEMIEQPLPRGNDDELIGFNSPITLAGDESCLHSAELDAAAERYQMVNIKLDKTGGLTEALKLAQLAKAKGLKLMVGNMCGSSLAMAPAFVIAQLCDFVDIDGPILNRYDLPFGLRYNQNEVDGLDPRLWG